MRTARQIRAEIKNLIPKAESGEQWAEICALEAEAVELEKSCACGHELRSESEQRNGVCRECL